MIIPVKKAFISIISIIIVASFSFSCTMNNSNEAQLKEIEKKAKILFPGKWELVGTRCEFTGLCYKKVTLRVEKIVFANDGTYSVGDKTFTYRIKNDFLYMDYNNSQCKFKYVFLDDNTLLYGALSNLQKFVRVK